MVTQYTVGSGKTYASLSAAEAALDGGSDLTDDTEFLCTGEVGNAHIIDWTLPNASGYKITIKPDSGVDPWHQGASMPDMDAAIDEGPYLTNGCSLNWNQDESTTEHLIEDMGFISTSIRNPAGSNNNLRIRRCAFTGSYSSVYPQIHKSKGGTWYIHHCPMWESLRSCIGISKGTVHVGHCTIFDPASHGISKSGGAIFTVDNCIVGQPGATFSCYSGTMTKNNCVSSDATGTTGKINITMSDILEDLTAAQIDLHYKTSATEYTGSDESTKYPGGDMEGDTYSTLCGADAKTAAPITLTADVLELESEILTPVVDAPAVLTADVLETEAEILTPVIIAPAVLVADVLETEAELLDPLIILPVSLTADVLETESEILTPVVNAPAVLVADILETEAEILTPVVDAPAVLVADVLELESELLDPLIILPVSLTADVLELESEVLTPVVNAPAVLVADVLETESEILTPVVNAPAVLVADVLELESELLTPLAIVPIALTADVLETEAELLTPVVNLAGADILVTPTRKLSGPAPILIVPRQRSIGSLEFDANNERVNHGQDTSLETLPAGTVLLWAQSDVLTPSGNRYILSKGSGPRVFQNPWVTNSLRAYVGRGITNLEINAAVADFAHFRIGTWVCWAFSWDVSGANGDQKMWIGDLVSPLKEPSSYITQTVGSGTQTSDSGSDLYVGEASGLGEPWDGRVALAALWDEQLSEEDLRKQQFVSMPIVRRSGCVLFTPYRGTGAQIDLSGRGNHGVLTGPTLAPSMPLPARRKVFDIGAPLVLPSGQPEVPHAPEPLLILPDRKLVHPRGAVGSLLIDADSEVIDVDGSIDAWEADPCSVVAWVFIPTQPSANYCTIMEKYAGSAFDRLQFAYRALSSGYMALQKSSPGTDLYASAVDGTMRFGEWTIMCWSFDSSRSSQDRVGLFQGTLNEPVADVKTSEEASPGSLVTTNDRMAIGNNTVNPTPDDELHGHLACIALFDRWIEQTEFEDLRTTHPSDWRQLSPKLLWDRVVTTGPQIDKSGNGYHGYPDNATPGVSMPFIPTRTRVFFPAPMPVEVQPAPAPTPLAPAIRTSKSILGDFRVPSSLPSMSLTNGSSNQLDYGSAAALDNRESWSFLTWVYRTAGTTLKAIWAKYDTTSGDGWQWVYTHPNGSYPDGWQMAVRCTSGGAQFEDYDGLPSGEWICLAGTFDLNRSGDMLRGFRARLGERLQAISPDSVLNTGSGGVDDDTDGPLCYLSDARFTDAQFPGFGAMFANWNGVVTLDDLCRQQYSPVAVPHARLQIFDDMRGRDGAHVDQSGRGNHGSVSGGFLPGPPMPLPGRTIILMGALPSGAVPITLTADVLELEAELLAPVVDSAIALTADVLETEAELLTPVVDAPAVLIADVLELESELLTAIVNSPAILVADVLETESELLTPITYSPATLVADVLELESELLTAIIFAPTSLVADVLELESEVLTPVVDSPATLTADVLELESELLTPVVVLPGSPVILTAEVIELESELLTPVVDAPATLVADVLETESELLTPIVYSPATLTADVLELESEVLDPVVVLPGSPVIVTADVLELESELLTPIVYSPATLTADVMELESELLTPVVYAQTALVADVLELESEVLDPVVNLLQAIFADSPVLSLIHELADAELALSGSVDIDSPVQDQIFTNIDADILGSIYLDAPVLDLTMTQISADPVSSLLLDSVALEIVHVIPQPDIAPVAVTVDAGVLEQKWVSVTPTISTSIFTVQGPIRWLIQYARECRKRHQADSLIRYHKETERV